MKEFVHLHVHTEYSLLDGANRISDIAKTAKEYKQRALAITDHGNMFGALEHYNECIKAGVKPIIGCEVYISKHSHIQKHTKTNTYNHLTLIASNLKGYQNLLKLTSLSFIEGLSSRPRISWDLLNRYSEGIICLSGCLSGKINELILDGKNSEALDFATNMYDIFGKGNFWLEIQRNGLNIQQKATEGIYEIHKKTGYPLVATNDIHYHRHEDCDFQDTMLCINTGARKEDPDRFRLDSDSLYFKSSEQMYDSFKDVYESVYNTLQIADKIDLIIPQGKFIFPKSNNVNPDVTLTGITKQTLIERKLDSEVYRARLEYELKVIKDLGFAEYFLVVRDLIIYAKSNGIPVGPGRGSAAGCLISYLLGITSLDPIRHGLLFERFINSERKGLPDIDIDFCQDRRKEIINYLKDKYGDDKVSSIITFGRFGAKKAIRQVAKALSIPLKESDAIAKKMLGDSILDSIAKDESLALDKSKYPELFKVAEKIEGYVEYAGTHASGIIIADRPLYEVVPLARLTSNSTGDSTIVTQWDLESCEKAGLVKFDILGLETLTIINRIERLVKERHNVSLSLNTIGLDHKPVYDLLSQGDTEGVFQCYSDGMRRLLKQMKPDKFDDIIAAIALFRPGPLECLSKDCVIVRRRFKDKKKNRWHYEYETIEELYKHFIEFKKNPFMKGKKLKIVSLNELNSELVYNNINDVMYKGKQLVKKLLIRTSQTTTNTISISATIEHKFLKSTGDWVRLGDLKPGDYVALNNKWNGKKSHRNTKGIIGQKNFRNICFYHYKYQCVFCNWNEGSLDVNHLDGNRTKDNSPENLCWMCPNHHRMYSEGNISKEEATKARDQYKIHFSKDIRFAPIVSIEDDGLIDTYDISVEDPHNNYIANDFVVHNSGIVDHYIKRKHGLEPVSYIHPDLKEIMETTYGTMVYQEQIMRLASTLAGFTLNQADELRKAVGKKLPEELAKIKDKFINGCRALKKVDDTIANDIWNQIEKFGRYGFNQSHSASYGYLTYYTAYLKCKYPIEFFCANLTQEMNDPSKLKAFITDAKRHDINIIKPDVIEGRNEFTISGNDSIRIGFGAISGIGNHLSSISLGNQNNPRCSTELESLLESIPELRNKTVITGLVYSGALDRYDNDRRRLLVRALHYTSSIGRNSKAPAQDIAELFGVKDDRNNDIHSNDSSILSGNDPSSTVFSKEDLRNERTAFGFYLSGHPVTDDILYQARSIGCTTITEVLSYVKDTHATKIVGVVTDIEVKAIKSGVNKGRKYARILVEDQYEQIVCMLFSTIYERYIDIIKESEESNVPLTLYGTVEISGDKPNMSIKSVNHLDKEINKSSDFKLRVTDKIISNIDNIKALCIKYPGNKNLCFIITEGYTIKTNIRVDSTPDFIKELDRILN